MEVDAFWRWTHFGGECKLEVIWTILEVDAFRRWMQFGGGIWMHLEDGCISRGGCTSFDAFQGPILETPKNKLASAPSNMKCQPTKTLKAIVSSRE